jgi:hypothetical protein
VILVRPVLNEGDTERQGPNLIQQLFKGGHGVNGNTVRLA